MLFVQLYELVSKLTSPLIPCSPVVTQARKKRSRNMIELLPIAVESPAPQSHNGETDSRKGAHSQRSCTTKDGEQPSRKLGHLSILK
jgi:hypothetical protein